MATSTRPHQLRYVEGDTLPGLTGYVTDDDGAAINISGYVITLHIDYDTPVIVTAAIPDPENGKYIVQWGVDDLVEGVWGFELQIVNPQGGVVTINRHSDNDELLELVIDRQVS